MGKVCICGASDLHIDYTARVLQVGRKTIKEGEYISIDGTLGEVYEGEVQTAPSEVVQVLVKKSLKPSRSRTYQHFNKLMNWADKLRKLGIRTNADQPDQATNAILRLGGIRYWVYVARNICSLKVTVFMQCAK